MPKDAVVNSGLANVLLFCGSPRRTAGPPRDDEVLFTFSVIARNEVTWQSIFMELYIPSFPCFDIMNPTPDNIHTHSSNEPS